ncbi:type II secretion system protein [bacterium]|nr:type II secretion system protein [bacterium]
MKKFIAFTLAETLIVMGVIGIVSALTLPNLNSSTGDKERVAKVKKIYQNLNDALGRAEAVYGPYEEWLLMMVMMQQLRLNVQENV